MVLGEGRVDYEMSWLRYKAKWTWSRAGGHGAGVLRIWSFFSNELLIDLIRPFSSSKQNQAEVMEISHIPFVLTHVSPPLLSTPPSE